MSTIDQAVNKQMANKNRYKFHFGEKNLTLTTDKDNLFMEEVERVAYEKYKIIFISQLTFCSKSSIIYNCNAAQKRRKTFFESALMASSKTEEVYFNVRYS